MVLQLELPPLRILDFDIENRPLSYLGFDWTTSDITAIAASFGSDMHCWCLGEVDQPTMLEEFRALWNQADIVTGHYILMHDIPIINGAMTEHGLPLLEEKRVQDTKIHLRRLSGVSKSQESLGEMLGVSWPKEHVSPQQWRVANRLQNLEDTKRRVIGDVQQHMELRRILLERGLLKPAMPWRP